MPFTSHMGLKPIRRRGTLCGHMALVKDHVVDVVLVPVLDHRLKAHHVVFDLKLWGLENLTKVVGVVVVWQPDIVGPDLPLLKLASIRELGPTALLLEVE